MSRDDPRDCTRCNGPLAGDNPGTLCYKCRRIMLHWEEEMSDEPKHTPLPLTIAEAVGWPGLYDVLDGDGYSLVSHATKTNARLVMCAVNAHDGLVKALEAIILDLETAEAWVAALALNQKGVLGNKEALRQHRQAAAISLEQARAALALAKGDEA